MNAADINAAAAEAQGDIDTYAANSLASAALVPAVPRTPPAPPSVPTPAPTRSANVADAPLDEDRAQGAANVVRTYFALIEAHNYGQAWQLWDDGGRASGLSRTQFAASFAKYAEYHAEVGAPGRVDAGAGQRYVQVPVRVYGTLTGTTARFVMRGEITLHRTADIDGATIEQRSWRIREASLRPLPAEATTAAASVRPVGYRCAGTTRFSVRFDDGDEVATIRPGDQRPASGIWYRAGGNAVRGEAYAVDATAPGRPPVPCTATD